MPTYLPFSITRMDSLVLPAIPPLCVRSVYHFICPVLFPGASSIPTIHAEPPSYSDVFIMDNPLTKRIFDLWG